MGFLYNNFISRFFTQALEFINGIVGSYGWSIVILTILFRLALLPLDIRQKKNMRKQQELQPKIDKINKKYANDKEMQSKKTMELYKKEGFNPMSGCLPMLLQMPIFFAFFGALRFLANEQIFTMFETIRDAGANAANFQFEGWLWVRNIWGADNFWDSVVPAFKSLAQYANFASITEVDYNTVMAPLVKSYEAVKNGWFILPLLAGTMAFLQTKLMTPQKAPQKSDQPSANPMSGKTMQYIMPLFSVFICTTASAAFSLYWATSNLISVGSYLVMDRVFKITRPSEPEGEKRNPAGYLK